MDVIVPVQYINISLDYCNKPEKSDSHLEEDRRSFLQIWEETSWCWYPPPSDAECSVQLETTVRKVFTITKKFLKCESASRHSQQPSPWLCNFKLREGWLAALVQWHAVWGWPSHTWGRDWSISHVSCHFPAISAEPLVTLQYSDSSGQKPGQELMN